MKTLLVAAALMLYAPLAQARTVVARPVAHLAPGAHVITRSPRVVVRSPRVIGAPGYYAGGAVYDAEPCYGDSYYGATYGYQPGYAYARPVVRRYAYARPVVRPHVYGRTPNRGYVRRGR
jgi:hypothetical protein